jgi:hypothetical protein
VFLFGSAFARFAPLSVPADAAGVARVEPNNERE